MTLKEVLQIFVISIIVFVQAFQAKGQLFGDHKLFKLGFDVSIGTTTKNSPFGYALGLNVLSKWELSPQLSAETSLGYTRLLTKDTSPIADYDFIPVKGAIKIFPTSTSFFLFGAVGSGFGIQKGSKPSFLFGGGTGYEWESYNVGLKYEGYQQSRHSKTYHPLNGQFGIVFCHYF